MGSRNQRTLAAYEQIAFDYAESTRGTPSGEIAELMRRFVDSRPNDGPILEIGSGPGWDADFLESLGASVRRTDATQAFCDFQRARGKVVERLDATLDPFTDAAWPHYDGAIAMYVLQHIEREHIAAVLGNVSHALSPEGMFLVSIREGSGDGWEGDSDDNEYHLSLWEEPAFTQALARADLDPVRIVHTVDSEGPWLVYLARKRSADEPREQS